MCEYGAEPVPQEQQVMTAGIPGEAWVNAGGNAAATAITRAAAAAAAVSAAALGLGGQRHIKRLAVFNTKSNSQHWPAPLLLLLLLLLIQLLVSFICTTHFLDHDTLVSLVSIVPVIDVTFCICTHCWCCLRGCCC
jgi:hypothetical protein